MKKTAQIIALFFVLYTTSSFAWVSTGAKDKSYSFRFNLKGQILELSQKGESYNEAYEKAAQACFKYFKGGRHISQDRGLDIIDVCANPRSI